MLISIQFLRETCWLQYNFWERHVDFNTIFERDMWISIQFLRGTCWFNTIFDRDMLIQYNFWEGCCQFQYNFYMDVSISIHFLRDMSIALWFMRGICQFQYSKLVKSKHKKFNPSLSDINLNTIWVIWFLQLKWLMKYIFHRIFLQQICSQKNSPT